MSIEINQIIDLLNDVKQELDSIEDDQLKDDLVVKNLDKDASKVLSQLNDLNSKKEFFTKQLESLTKDLLSNYHSQISTYLNGYHSDFLQKYTYIHDQVNSLKTELKRIDYLSLIKGNNVILVGGNGVGKSSFASYLKDSMSNNIVVIPAQKFLFYDRSITSLHLTDKSKVNELQRENYIGRGKFYNSSDIYEVGRFTKELSELFSKLVTVIVNDQIESEHYLVKNGDASEESKKNTILYKMNELWSCLIPDIVFDIDTTNRMLQPIKNNHPYSLNSMSDGEKAMIYYICHVFFSRRK